MIYVDRDLIVRNLRPKNDALHNSNYVLITFDKEVHFNQNGISHKRQIIFQ